MPPRPDWKNNNNMHIICNKWVQSQPYLHILVHAPKTSVTTRSCRDNGQQGRDDNEGEHLRKQSNVWFHLRVCFHLREQNKLRFSTESLSRKECLVQIYLWLQANQWLGASDDVQIHMCSSCNCWLYLYNFSSMSTSRTTPSILVILVLQLLINY